MLPDLIITWLKHCDYPIFRKFLETYRYFFKDIYIYFSEHNRFPYFDHFIHDSLKDLKIIFIDPVLTDWSTEDWRNKSTNEMLKHSNAEWVCSIEQDFFSKDWNRLLDTCENLMKTEDMFGWLNHTAHSYIHPAFWFIKREVLDKTSKDFSAHPEIVGSDHFATITYDVMQLGAKIKTIQVVGFKTDITTPENTDCYHQGGINNNYLDGINANRFHREELFYIYNYWSSVAPVKQSSEFIRMMLKVESILKLKYPYIDPNTNEWSVFFK